MQAEKMDNSGWNMYVFRDGRTTVRGESIRRVLLDALHEFIDAPSEDNCVAALIAAGELECALEDAEAGSAEVSRVVTAALAEALVAKSECDGALVDRVQRIRIPEQVRTAVAEGFAYYALHPRKFVDLIQRLELPGSVRVVGLRSIGTTLSAVVMAALCERGVDAERITVRPAGHPYERELRLSAPEREWLLAAGSGSTVLVVDEGPGISGSSFLAVAEAVEAAGIDGNRILMIGSRVPDVEQLRAPNGSSRWRRFRFATVSEQPILPDQAQDELGGGLWRRTMLTDFENQPASWTQLESSKYWSSDRRSIFKFHGYGHYGETIVRRARKLAEAGFSPGSKGLERGFGRYEFVEGRVSTRADLTSEVLRRVAEYCALRKSEFAVEVQPSELNAMANWNWECEFGNKLEPPVELENRHPVIADGRMMPHEWLLAADGRLLKTDAVSHGDDHFFPGPCDIAWDVAGAIVEWEMDASQAADFVEQYRVLSGDDVSSRLSEYVLAYSIFRMAWSKMAARASEGQFDEALLVRDCARYRVRALEAEKNRVKKRVPANAA